MKSVQDLFFDGTDKGVFKWDHYLPIYESLFREFVGKPVTVLEIGVLRGGSLRMWRDYFGSQSQIYGVDIDPAAKQHESDGIRVFIGDQTDKQFLSRMAAEAGGFDIVIDDGGHTNRMVLSSFETLYAATRRLYVVEDTHVLYWWGGLYSLLRDVKFAIVGKGGLGVATALASVVGRFLTGRLSFMRLVRRRQDALTTDWHGAFRVREGGAAAGSEFAANTAGIRVYDSLVVFEKASQPPRRAEMR